VAKKVTTIIVSDFTGEPIPADEAVTITIAYADRSRGKVHLDAAESEVIDLIEKGQYIPPRGRARPRRRSAD
jgi:hypothetical protein